MIEDIRRFNRFYARALGIFSSRYLDSDLTMTEVRILGEIDREPGLTASDICTILSLDKSYLSRMIAWLEAQGFVTRERKAENRRYQSLFLMAKGQASSLALDARANARIEGQIAALTAAEQKELVASMQTIERLLFPVVPPEKRRETRLTLRAALPQELDTAMGFIRAAKAYLKAQGIDQWQNDENPPAVARGFFMKLGQ